MAVLRLSVVTDAASQQTEDVAGQMDDTSPGKYEETGISGDASRTLLALVLGPPDESIPIASKSGNASRRRPNRGRLGFQQGRSGRMSSVRQSVGLERVSGPTR
jgi:hypothetical protein